MEEGLRIRFWGTRGSIAAPYSDRMEFGGNTSCVSVDWAEGLAVFDGGTGLVELGRRIKEASGRLSSKETRIHIFVSHLHLDHIVGLCMFPCLFCRDMAIELYGPCEEGLSFRERFWAAMSHPFWPVTMEQTAARITWHDTKDGDIWILPGDVKVKAMSSRHPDGGVMYRLDGKTGSVVYGLDCEPGEEQGDFWKAYEEFARGCDLLIFDAPYGEEEYEAHRGFGHGFWQQGLLMARKCGAGRLYISHHEWERTDGQLAAAEREARRKACDREGFVVFAREGACVCLQSGDERGCE